MSDDERRYYLDQDYPRHNPDGDTGNWTFDDVRKLIVLSRMNGDDSAAVHAQMLSDLDKLEAEGKPIPAYSWHLGVVTDEIEKYG